MANHTVTFSTPSLEIGKADIVFTIRKDKEKLGDLHISHGAAVWFPTGNSYGYKLSWSKLAALFVEHGIEKAEMR
jgi:hypothetical protein